MHDVLTLGIDYITTVHFNHRLPPEIPPRLEDLRDPSPELQNAIICRHHALVIQITLTKQIGVPLAPRSPMEALARSQCVHHCYNNCDESARASYHEAIEDCGTDIGLHLSPQPDIEFSPRQEGGQLAETDGAMASEQMVVDSPGGVQREPPAEGSFAAYMLAASYHVPAEPDGR